MFSLISVIFTHFSPAMQHMVLLLILSSIKFPLIFMKNFISAVRSCRSLTLTDVHVLLMRSIQLKSHRTIFFVSSQERLAYVVLLSPHWSQLRRQTESVPQNYAYCRFVYQYSRSSLCNLANPLILLLYLERGDYPRIQG